MRIGIVDDHALYRLGLETAVAREPDLDVVWSCSSAPEALERQRQEAVDLVTVDINLDGAVDGISLTRQLRALPAAPVVVIITAFADPDVIGAARLSGAADLVPKSLDTGDLIARIRRITSGEDLSFSAAVPAPSRGPNPWGLTPRELEVLAFLRVGRSNREIARTMVLSVPTVSNHVTNILRKMGAKSRAHAGRLAQTGLANTD